MLVDQNGQPYGVPHINGKPRVSDMPYLFDIAQGFVPRHEPWSKMGFHPGISTSETTIWVPGTQYVWPVTGQQMEVRSSDNLHDIPAGDGALTVWFKYLNLLGDEKTEFVTMNGTTNVNTVATDIYRIQNFRVATTGATGKAFGNIDIRNLTDHTTVYSRIGASMTRARNSVWTVPRNHTLYVSSIAFSIAYTSAGKTARFTTHATWDNDRQAALTKGVFFMPYYEVELVDNAYTKALELPTSLPENTDIKISIIGEANAVATSALRGWLELNV